MFELTKDDLKRVAWTFIQATLAFGLLAWADAIRQGQDWSNGEFASAILGGAIAAGISAVKNALTSSGSALK
jgi:hypothetical protein